MKYGTTFSQLQCKYLGLDYQEAFKAILELPLDTIRLCAYWNEIENQKSTVEISVLNWLIEEASKKNKTIVLALGLKSPRWPEFHIPNWLPLPASQLSKHPNLTLDTGEIRDKTLRYLELLVQKTKHHPNLAYYQVENEPLNGMDINGHVTITEAFLASEINMVHKNMRQSQKILLTNAIYLWPPDSRDDEAVLTRCIEMAQTGLSTGGTRRNVDGVGIHVYSRVPTNRNNYLEPTQAFWDKLKRWQKLLTDSRLEAWIAEAQAEPWENGNHVHTGQLNYPSASPEMAKELVHKLSAMSYKPILLWGCEYWYWHKKQGSNIWWDMVEKLESRI